VSTTLEDIRVNLPCRLLLLLSSMQLRVASLVIKRYKWSMSLRKLLGTLHGLSMNLADSRTFRVMTGVFGALTLVMVWVALSAHGQGHKRMSLPQDWSHHHLVFTPPSSIAQAWKLQREPRFWHQVLSRNASARQDDHDAGLVGRRGNHGNGRRNLEHTDWGMSLLAGGKAGAGVYPAKFTFDINATPDCINDYVAFTTSLAGSSSQPSIIAFDELYSTQGSSGGLCNQNGPSVKWAYKTGTGTVVTSPVLAADGSKVAYVETAAGGATLHILKWKPGATATVQGTLNAPATPDTTLTAGQAWNTTNCPTANSCVVNIAFSGAIPDTNSSPFYNYATDELYVGDDSGNVHKFIGVFNGTPAEAGAPWPVATGNKNTLGSPVFDSVTSNVFVGDSGGFLYSISSTGTVIASNRVAFRSGFVDGPIVDSSAAMVYIFGSANTNSVSTSAAVWQFSTGFAAGSSGSSTTLGSGIPAAGATFFGGAFDNIYFTSANSASPTGNLYVCGNPGGNATLYRIPITANVIGAANAMATAMSTASTTCSPVTEILNGSTDWIFVSVQSSPNVLPAIGCPLLGGGCIMSFNVTAGTTPTATAARAAASGGTSGIVIDNVSASTQASSLYFTYLSNGIIGSACNGVIGVGCAIKLTQSGLQ